MQSSIWKLAALAGVVGIGFLVVMQTQRGLVRDGQPSDSERELAAMSELDAANGQAKGANSAGPSAHGSSEEPFNVEQDEPALAPPVGPGVELGQSEPFPTEVMQPPASTGSRTAARHVAARVPEPFAGFEASATVRDREAGFEVGAPQGTRQVAGADLESANLFDGLPADSTGADESPADGGVDAPGLLFNDAGASGDATAPTHAHPHADAARQAAAAAVRNSRAKPLRAAVATDADISQPATTATTIPPTNSAPGPALLLGATEEPQPADAPEFVGGPQTEMPAVDDGALPESHPAIETLDAEAGLNAPAAVTNSEPAGVATQTAAEPPPEALSTESADSAEPDRLDPALRATRLDPEDKDEIDGSGTVDSESPTGPQRPQIKIEKIAPPKAALGQPMIYSILIKNLGKSDAQQVVVEDQIPKGTKLVGTIPRAEMIDKRLLWRMGTVKPGEEKKIRIKVIPITEGQIGSIATVNFVAEVAAETVVTSPKLQLTMTAPQQIELGESVDVKFQMSNQGSGEAAGVLLRNVLPAVFTHPGGSDLEYEVGVIPPGETREVTLKLTAAAPGQARSRAVITAEGGFTTDSELAFRVVGNPLAIERTGPRRYLAGRTTAFENKVMNKSILPVAGAAVVERLPRGLDFIEASHGGSFDPDTRTVTWKLEAIPGNETQTVTLKVHPTAPGKCVNTITVTDAEGNRSEAVAETEIVGFSALAIDLKQSDGAVLLGDQVPVHVVLRNRGTSAATNVAVTLVVPAQMNLASAKGPAAYVQTGGQIKFDPIPRLEPGTDLAFDVVLAAEQAGDARLQIQIQSDQLDRPLAREEAIVILSSASE